MGSHQYCLFSLCCFTLSEWKDIALALCAIIGAGGVLVTAVKTFKELEKLNNEKKKEQELKSIEFTLEQHRRLFDDKELYSVLCLIDSDDAKLALEEMWDSKRKLIVFFEEIQLLINSEKINKNIAYYLFGYYAVEARKGVNFCTGIHLVEKYFGLFFIFARESDKYLRECEKNPKLVTELRFSVF